MNARNDGRSLVKRIVCLFGGKVQVCGIAIGFAFFTILGVWLAHSLPLETDMAGVENALNSNMTLSGTLIAVIGILLGVLRTQENYARKVMIMLIFSTVVLMGMSTLIVFFSFIYLDNATHRETVEPAITGLFVSLPLNSIFLATVIPIAYIRQNAG